MGGIREKEREERRGEKGRKRIGRRWPREDKGGLLSPDNNGHSLWNRDDKKFSCFRHISKICIRWSPSSFFEKGNKILIISNSRRSDIYYPPVYRRFFFNKTLALIYFCFRAFKRALLGIKTTKLTTSNWQ